MAGHDLKDVVLKRSGDDITISFTTARPIPPTGTALFSVDAWNGAGDTGYQMGVKYQDGLQIAHFVFDQVQASQANLDGDASTSGTTTTATFPLDELDGLGDSFKWTALYNVEGNDVDVCPEPGDDILNEKKAIFPDRP